MKIPAEDLTLAIDDTLGDDVRGGDGMGVMDMKDDKVGDMVMKFLTSQDALEVNMMSVSDTVEPS